MDTIYKYELPVEADRVKIWIPGGSKVLCAKEQHGKICIWAEVDTEVTSVPLVFEIIPTGAAVDNSGIVHREYIDTVMLHGGALVLHVYKIAF